MSSGPVPSKSGVTLVSWYWILYTDLFQNYQHTMSLPSLCFLWYLLYLLTTVWPSLSAEVAPSPQPCVQCLPGEGEASGCGQGEQCRAAASQEGQHCQATQGEPGICSVCFSCGCCVPSIEQWVSYVHSAAVGRSVFQKGILCWSWVGSMALLSVIIRTLGTYFFKFTRCGPFCSYRNNIDKSKKEKKKI